MTQCLGWPQSGEHFLVGAHEAVSMRASVWEALPCWSSWGSVYEGLSLGSTALLELMRQCLGWPQSGEHCLSGKKIVYKIIIKS